jgi:hypothetical protein
MPRTPLDLPDWVPRTVVEKIRWIEKELGDSALVEGKLELLRRLGTDERMRAVFSELRSFRQSPPSDYSSGRAPTQERSQAGTETALGVLFGLVFAHGCNALFPVNLDRLVRSRVPDLVESLGRLRAEGGGVLRSDILAFGCAETAPKAFVQSIVPVLMDLFGSAHWSLMATITGIVFGRVYSRVQVRRLAGWLPKVTVSENRKKRHSGHGA